MSKIIAFIPLRGGSKSIPLKNIQLLNGRPMAYYALDAAVNCDKIDQVVVTTDSEEIKKVILEYPSNKIVVVGRSPEVSQDTSPTIDVILEYSQNVDFDTMVHLQATSVLTTAQDLENGLSLLNQGWDSVLSVVRQHRFIWNEDTHLPNDFTIPHKPRRQDWRGILVENGAFYINSRENILRDRFYLSGKIGLCEMPANTYIEIDEPSDWIIMEQILKYKNK